MRNLKKICSSIPSFIHVMAFSIMFSLSFCAHAESSSTDKNDIFTTQYEASLWLMKTSIRMEKFVRNDLTRMEILRTVYTEAKKNNLDPNLVLSVMHVESRFNPKVVSHAGAQGLMQIMPFWKNELGAGKKENLHDIKTNISYGCKILKIYLAQEKGNPMRALARYNGSTGQIWYPTRVLKAWKNNWLITG